MKKLLLSAFAAAAILSAQAQSDNEGGIRFGVKVGAAYSSVRFSDNNSNLSINSGAKVGFTGGVSAKIPLGEGGFSVQPEVNYSMMGGKTNIDLQGFGTSESTINANYIQIPILAQYEFSNSGFHVGAGPQIGILAGGKTKNSDNLMGMPPMNEEEDTKDSFKSTDFSLLTTIAYQFPSLPIRIDIRGQLGLANIVKDSQDGKGRINGGMITVGYTF